VGLSTALTLGCEAAEATALPPSTPTMHDPIFRLRRSSERGHADHGWLSTYHTFSFADYYDPAHMGFRALRVINEDRVQPGRGFGTHPHRDMEIITYVLSGALQHRDSMGHGSVIRPGELQRLSAGTGITHSEFNASSTSVVHLLQIWLLPTARGLTPSYAQKAVHVADRPNQLHLIASPDGAEQSVTIASDARLFGAVLEAGSVVTQQLESGRHAWVQVARGEVRAAGQALGPGDGLALSQLAELRLEGITTSELLIFDLG